MIGARIKALRKARGMKQRDLAPRLGVTREAIAQWESGRANPTAGRLHGIAEVFGVTVDELVTPEPPKETT